MCRHNAFGGTIPCLQCVGDAMALPSPTPKQFYMVYVEGGHAPTVSHLNYAEAAIEAERLAKHTQRAVYILKAITEVKEEVVPAKVEIKSTSLQP